MGRQSELVSIIVPVYNAEAYIEDTIAMVRGQSWRNWELILVDDGSSDGSLERIRACMEAGQEHPAEEEKGQEEGQIRLLCQPCNGGAARARNRGIQEAKGRYIAFLDADDIWQTDKLERELAFMRDNQAAFVFSAYEFGDEQAQGTGKIVHVPATLTYREALSRTVIFTSTVLLDTEKIDRGLIQMPEVESEDTATWWKLLRAGLTAYGLDEVLAIYRRPARSLSSNKLKAIRRIWGLYRRQEGLPLIPSCYYLFFWALRATLRRI